MLNRNKTLNKNKVKEGPENIQRTCFIYLVRLAREVTTAIAETGTKIRHGSVPKSVNSRAWSSPGTEHLPNPVSL